MSATPCLQAPTDATVCAEDCEVLLDERLPQEKVSWSLGADPTADGYYPIGIDVDSAGTVRALLRAVAGADRLAERTAKGWKLSPLPEGAANARLADGCGGTVLVAADEKLAAIWSRPGTGAGWSRSELLQNGKANLLPGNFGQVRVAAKGL